MKGGLGKKVMGCCEDSAPPSALEGLDANGTHCTWVLGNEAHPAAPLQLCDLAHSRSFPLRTRTATGYQAAVCGLRRALRRSDVKDGLHACAATSAGAPKRVAGFARHWCTSHRPQDPRTGMYWRYNMTHHVCHRPLRLHGGLILHAACPGAACPGTPVWSIVPTGNKTA